MDENCRKIGIIIIANENSAVEYSYEILIEKKIPGREKYCMAHDHLSAEMQF